MLPEYIHDICPGLMAEATGVKFFVQNNSSEKAWDKHGTSIRDLI